MKRHGRREMIGEGRFREVEGSRRREKIGGGRRRGDTKRRCRGKGGGTGDPSTPMGRRELRWWGRGGRDSTVSPPVDNGVGGIRVRGFQAPSAPPPTY
jgi:hypothetical protein